MLFAVPSVTMQCRCRPASTVCLLLYAVCIRGASVPPGRAAVASAARCCVETAWGGKSSQGPQTRTFVVVRLVAKNRIPGIIHAKYSTRDLCTSLPYEGRFQLNSAASPTEYTCITDLMKRGGVGVGSGIYILGWTNGSYVRTAAVYSSIQESLNLNFHRCPPNRPESGTYAPRV